MAEADLKPRLGDDKVYGFDHSTTLTSLPQVLEGTVRLPLKVVIISIFL